MTGKYSITFQNTFNSKKCGMSINNSQTRWGDLTEGKLNPEQCDHTLVKTPSGLSRRLLLAQGLRVGTVTSLAALFQALEFPQPAQALDWSNLLGSRQQGGGGSVKDLQGRAFAQNRPLKPGDRVESGLRIRVEKNSHLLLSLDDGSIFRITGTAEVDLELGTGRRGVFRMLVGGLLAVLPSRSQYLVHSPSATIGIKGTVFYQQQFEPEMRMAMGMEGPVTIPEGLTEYFCLCNGASDYLLPGQPKPFFEDTAQHHNPFFLKSGTANPLVPSEMINHTDTQISALISQQQGQKHDASWLEL